MSNQSNDEDDKDHLHETDGFDDAEDGVEGESEQPQRVIQGEKINFTNDFTWVTVDDEEIAKDREFLVANTMRVVQKWEDDQVVETIFVQPNQKWPDVAKLNAACPKSEWREGRNNQLEGPWQRARVTYLVDLQTAQRYTHASGTVGTDICVREFRDRVAMMRQFRGERVYAVITLGSAFMRTKYGGRQRPDFKIVRWLRPGSGGTTLPMSPTPQLPPANTEATPGKQTQLAAKPTTTPTDAPVGMHTVEPPSLSEQMGNDKVPW